jgi:ribose transport system ATP-binding protein
MTAFSGGNQQKVMFAKWDQLDPRVFILHEPTQGVDPSAGRELMERIVARAAAGTAVIVVSGDHEQLVELCHRVLVMVDGSPSAEILRADLSEESLLVACSR